MEKQTCIILEKNMPTYNFQTFEVPQELPSLSDLQQTQEHFPNMLLEQNGRNEFPFPILLHSAERLHVTGGSYGKLHLERLACTNRYFLNYYFQLLLQISSARFLGSVQPIIAPLTASG